MKKRIMQLFPVAFATLALCVAACSEDSTKADDPAPEPVVPPTVDHYLTAQPDGQEDLTYALKPVTEAGEWRIVGDEPYDWIEVTPAQGTGDATLTFVVEFNDTGAERAATFEVAEGNYVTFTLFVTQAKADPNVNASDLEFLQALVEGRMLGDATPTVESWYQIDPGAFKGVTLTDKNGKYYITELRHDNGEELYTDLPAKMHLPELTHIFLDGQTGLAGKKLPADWNTPKLVFARCTGSGLTGPIPEGLAASPVLIEIYFDKNNFYGALPHNWASTSLKALIFANQTTPSTVGEDPVVHTGDNPGLGYLVPATLDVCLNNYRTDESGNSVLDNSDMYFKDKTQMKLGGVDEGNFLGFEAGWGQVRYEKYDANAVVGDKTVWSDSRLLADDWAYFFSNMGYPGRAGGIAKTMMEWNQADADAYTAAAKAKYDPEN